MTRKLIALIEIAMITYPLPAFATIINIPDDYATIQRGIDASSHGDTVLVQPGTYVENINFNGHNIVLGSLFLTTGDTTYISETVIDGDSSGSVVTFESGEDSTTVITGFTIQNGYTNIEAGGGVRCLQTAPIILKAVYCQYGNLQVLRWILFSRLHASGQGKKSASRNVPLS